jgi:hypothetical protein
MKTIKVTGMHCDACKKIMMMEFEETGLELKVKHIDVLPDKKGLVTLADSADDSDADKISKIINNMEGYSTE